MASALPAGALEHVRHDVARHVEETEDVRLDHLFPIVNLGILHGLDAPRQARIVDEDIDVEQARMLLRDGLDVGAAAHVEDDGGHVGAVAVGPALGLLLEDFLAPPGHDNLLAAVAAERLSGGLADTRRGSRDENAGVGKRGCHGTGHATP